MLKKILFSLMCFSLVFLIACGITEELEQAKVSVKELKATLKHEETLYDELIANLSNISAALKEDLTAQPETGRYPDGEGAIYNNFEERKELLAEMTNLNQEIIKSHKELSRIVKKNGADVDNKQLTLINQSLDIIIGNFASLEVYTNLNETQADEFYRNLPAENLETQLSILHRTYGAIEIVSEEAQANIEYTLSLVDKFLAEAPKSKEKSK